MSFDYYAYDRFELLIENDKLICKEGRLNLTDKVRDKYNNPDFAKLYLLRNKEFYQYIGTTFQPIKKRLAQGMMATGINGYHGYKWKNKTEIELFVWCFEGLNKIQIENIEAELIYFIREKYGRWVISQNEIHFNNDFAFGRILAKEIFEYIEHSYPDYNETIISNKEEIVFAEPGQYGLRGDIYLWKELKALFQQSTIKNEREFIDFLYNSFENIVGDTPKKSEAYSVPRYRFGGMSSGGIDCDFWLEKGFPLLIKRYKETNKN